MAAAALAIARVRLRGADVLALNNAATSANTGTYSSALRASPIQR
jgi:hypothetical protein